MTKRMIAGIFALFLTLAAAGCGSQTESESEQPDGIVLTEAPSADDTQAETTEELEDEPETQSPTEEATAQETAEDTTEAAAEDETDETQDTTEAQDAVQPVQEPEQPPAEPAPAEPAPQTPDVPTPAPPPAPTEAPAQDQTLVFTYGGQSVSLGDNAQGFTAAVSPSFQEAAPSCYGNGEDINYYYDDFTVYVWNENGNYLVYGIDITGAGAATSSGITIGSSADDVTAAYGTAYSEEGMDRVYTFGDCTLRFTLLDGTVNYISYNKEI